jgi:hypothetical protein
MAPEWNLLEARARRVAAAVGDLRADLLNQGVACPPAKELPPALPPYVERLLEALNTFPALVGYLNGRRPSGGTAVIRSEADVQDLIYVSVKPIFPDMVYEEPTRKGAAGYSVGDFCIPSLKLILEIKFVGGREDVKAKADEISEDIWKYTTQTDCERVVFFVYDPHLSIPDRANYARSLSTISGDFRSKGREVDVTTVIRP